MKKRSKTLKTLGVTLSCALVFSAAMPVFAEGSTQEGTVQESAPVQSKEEAEAAKEQSQRNLDEVNGRISDMEAAKGSLQQNVEELDGKLNELDQKLGTLSADLETKESQIEEARKLLEEAQEDEKEQYEAMKKRIQFMYENGNYTYVELLLDAQSMTDLLNRADYISQISEYDRNMLQKYQETKELVAQREEQLQQKYAEGQNLKSEVESEQAEVEGVLSSKQEEISRYTSEIAESQSLAQEFANEVEAQNSVLAEIVAYEAQMRAIEEAQAAAQAQAQADAEAVRQQAEEAAAAAQAQSEAAAQAQMEAEARQSEAEAKQSEAEAAAQAAQRAEQEQRESEEQAQAQSEADRLAAEAEAARQEAEQQKQEAEQQQQQAEQQQQQAEQQQQAQQQQNQTTPGAAAGFIWPCPSSYIITSEYGYREIPTEGATSNHQGLDIGASYGSDILAAASGTVMTATYSISAGNYIIIYHGNGLSTVYMHASALYVSPGQTVNQGDVIAAVGSTGYSTGPHLHFGVTVNGSYVNPHDYVG